MLRLRSWHRVLVGLLACAALLARPHGAAASAPTADGKRPNIIFILADDLGYADLGSYGQKKIRTPRLDRMAAEGMRFRQFYAGAPVCAPSRCALLTGKHMGHAAIRDNREVQPEGQRPLPAAEVTLAELLKGRGYATAAVGKWGLGIPGSEGDPNRQGFDLFYGYHCQRHAHNHYPTYLRRNAETLPLEGNTGGATGKQFSHDLLEAEALRFIRDHRERPFFLYVPFAVPHLALQAPEEAVAEYQGQWEDPPYTGGNGYLPHPHPRAAYAAMVTRMDRSVGRILDLLKTLHLDANTLVLFSSDNGPTYGRLGGSDSAFFESAGPLRGFKGSVYEGGVRVPLIARWPGKIRRGSTSDRLSALWDVLPTACEAAGVAPPSGLDGISLLPALLGKGSQREHASLYWEFPAYGGQQALRLGDWKGVRQNLTRGPATFELYDLRKDPGETTDVSAQHPEVVARVAALMARSRTPSAQFPFPALDRPAKEAPQP